jgi:hypothetical protein
MDSICDEDGHADSASCGIGDCESDDSSDWAPSNTSMDSICDEDCHADSEAEDKAGRGRGLLARRCARGTQGPRGQGAHRARAGAVEPGPAGPRTESRGGAMR